MSNKKVLIRKENVVQAIVVADTFADEFVPLSNDIPLALFPLINKPLIDYTLEFLSLGGIEETFLFCCSHVDAVKSYIQKSIDNYAGWSLKMKVNIIASESCCSFGDCLRDIDAKGLLRGDFILLEPGTVSNIKLLPIIKKHIEVAKIDKGAAMTVVYQETGIGQFGRSPHEEVIIAASGNNRVLYHKKIGQDRERKINFPLEIFLENSVVSLHHNLKDTHIAICSPSVLPLFSDNFDFQTKDDFVKGLLINEEILGSTVYCHIVKGNQYGNAVTNFRMYQALSYELKNQWIYPLLPSKRNQTLKNDVIVSQGVKIPERSKLVNTVIGENVKIGNNVCIENSFIMANTRVEDGAVITQSIIGPNCHIKVNSKILAGSVLGKNVVIEKGKFIDNTLVQSTKPDFCCEETDKIGDKAYRIVTDDNDEDDVDTALVKPLSKLHIDDNYVNESEYESDDAFSSSDDEELSNTYSPAPDDTKLFFTEVIDSLTRGFEDELLCDNLILEINSSRYAYNVTLKEVNFNVVRAILNMSFREPTGPQYFSQLARLLSYFSPILKNYIRNEEAMFDSLQAIEDVALSSENLNEKWTMFVLKWFYDKDYITEDAILKWASTLDKKSKFHSQVKPFTDWLQEAEEATSDEDDDNEE